MKTLSNTANAPTKDNVPDLQTYGAVDLFKGISKSWSKEEGWMKSTKAMDVPGGVLVQVSTQQHDNVAEALAFVPCCRVVTCGEGYKLTSD